MTRSNDDRLGNQQGTTPLFFTSFTHPHPNAPPPAPTSPPWQWPQPLWQHHQPHSAMDAHMHTQVPPMPNLVTLLPVLIALGSAWKWCQHIYSTHPTPAENPPSPFPMACTKPSSAGSIFDFFHCKPLLPFIIIILC
jgi:hypothetical protein